MDAATLGQLEHENFVQAIWLVGSQVADSRLERAGGVALIATGLPLLLFNQVLIERDDAESEAIAAAVSVAREREVGFVVNLRQDTDDGHLPLMSQLGLVPLSADPWLPGMAMHPLPDPTSVGPPAGHEIRRVDDEAGLRDHVRTGAAGFVVSEELLASIVTPAILEYADAAVYVGYQDGMAVTTGLGFRIGRTIGVYNIATVESARRRGYGSAMTMRVVDDGRAAGCDVAVLQASAMGLQGYKRLGFQTVVEYVGFVEPGSLESQ